MRIHSHSRLEPDPRAAGSTVELARGAEVCAAGVCAAVVCGAELCREGDATADTGLAGPVDACASALDVTPSDLLGIRLAALPGDRLAIGPEPLCPQAVARPAEPRSAAVRSTLPLMRRMRAPRRRKPGPSIALS